MHLIRILEDVVPVCKMEWKQVLEAHSERFHGLDCASIRRKSQGLRHRKIPTGSPNIPEDVQLAKDV